MKIEATGTGKTIDDAIINACSKLGVDRDTVTVEVLMAPAKKMLGFMGGNDAEVLAYYDDGTPEPKPSSAKSAQKEKKEEAKKEKKEDKEVLKADKVIKKEDKAAKKETKKEKEIEGETEEPAGKSADTKLERAEAFLNKVLPYITSKPIEMKSTVTEEGVKINIEGEDINTIIGRRGETLDALQYLTGIVSAKSGEKHMRVYIDTGSYRARREETLEGLAKRYAERVQKTGRSLTLEPMSPNERRIVHMVIQEINGLESFSKGEGNARRVVIAPKR